MTDAENLLNSIKANDKKIEKLNKEIGKYEVAILVVADRLTYNQTEQAKNYLSNFIKKNNLKW